MATRLSIAALRSSGSGRRSPAICIRVNWSYGRSSLNARTTQSRYRQALPKAVFSSSPFESAYLATSSQCRPQRSP